jgi:D-glycero-D-manno-heptose 1,7-bisphosphate phosphatase
MQKTKLLLLDKDGTIVQSTHGEFVDEPWHQEPVHPGVAPSIDEAKKQGWEIKVCSNQGGVAAGHKSLEKVFQEMRFCLELFPSISEAYFCPDFDGNRGWYCWDDCLEEHRILRLRSDAHNWYPGMGEFPSFRKPGAGMLLAAAGLNYDRILFVGDRPEDLGAAQAAGCEFLWASQWWCDHSWLRS